MVKTVGAFLRAKWMGWLWTCAAMLLVMLLVQQVLGWPLKQRISFGQESVIKREGAVSEARLRLASPLAAWDAAFARVKENGVALPRLTNLTYLEAAEAGGWYLKGRSVYLHPRDERSLSGGGKAFTVELPWGLSAARVVALCFTFLLWTGVLAYAREPITSRFFSELGARPPERKRPWLWWIVTAAAMLIAGAALRIWGFSFPAIFSDTKDYLKPALLFSVGGKLTASPDRPFGYPLFLGLLLRAVADFRAVVVAQGAGDLVHICRGRQPDLASRCPAF